MKPFLFALTLLLMQIPLHAADYKIDCSASSEDSSCEQDVEKKNVTPTPKNNHGSLSATVMGILKFRQKIPEMAPHNVWASRGSQEIMESFFNCIVVATASDDFFALHR